MAKKPGNFQWIGFTPEQIRQLDFLDHLGNNGWARNPQSDAVMPSLLDDWAAEGLTIAELKQAMMGIGYSQRTVRAFDRWERKRTTGKFGRD